MTIIWCMVPEIWSVMDRIFCYFGPFFALYPPNNPKNQNFEKLEKTPGNIIILHMCNKIHDHMLYCSWDMAHDWCNYFSSWAIFCHFTSLTAWKIKILKKWKRKPEATIILQSVPKIMISSWDMTCDRCNYFSFWAIFCPFPP